MSRAHHPLRIGIVAHAGLGGSGTVATELAVGLAGRGHDVHMITPQRPFRLGMRNDVKVHELAAAAHPMWPSPPWTLALASLIVNVAKDAQLDILHAHFAVPYAIISELACQTLGAHAPPWLTTLHGSDVVPLGRDPAFAPLVRHALKRAAAITVPSRYLREVAKQELHTDNAIAVIPNFVDGGRFQPSAKRLPPSQQGATFVHASNFREVKRVADVVAIFAQVTQRSANAAPPRLLLLGDGPQRQAALDQLTALGLRDRVQAPGAQRDIEAYLATAHVALLPSERESFGLAALEALASAVPVVGSAVGGLPEVVKHGRNGYLAPVGDVTSMADAALSLVDDDQHWQQLASAARSDALQRFAPQRALDSYAALYRAVLSPAANEGSRDATHQRPSLHDI